MIKQINQKIKIGHLALRVSTDYKWCLFRHIFRSSVNELTKTYTRFFNDNPTRE